MPENTARVLRVLQDIEAQAYERTDEGAPLTDAIETAVFGLSEEDCNMVLVALLRLRMTEQIGWIIPEATGRERDRLLRLVSGGSAPIEHR